jgi:hypothetical protein
VSEGREAYAFARSPIRHDGACPVVFQC